MRRYIIIAALCILMYAGIPLHAQQDTSTCPLLVENALALIEDLCSGTSRNQACYGNQLLSVIPYPEIENFTFEAPGDIVDVAAIQRLQASAMNQVDESWGVGLMRLQANLPGTLIGQNVVMVLFGDVEIEAADSIPVTLTASVASGSSINVRGEPSTGSAVVTSLDSGAEVTLNGRTEAGDWLRAQLPDGEVGWIADFLLTSEDDLTTLNTLQGADIITSPLQAFYLRTGVGGLDCAEVPASGILLQNPAGAGQVTLTINEVRIDLASTAFVRAQANGNMTIDLLEGQAQVTAVGITIPVPAGTRAVIPMGARLTPAGPPRLELYEPDELNPLPVGQLDSAITIAEPNAAPIITGIVNFPNGEILGDSISRSFYINFLNPDGDEIVLVELFCVASDFPNGCGSWNLESGVDLDIGDWRSGRMRGSFFCDTGGPARLTSTFGVRMHDANNNQSNAAEFTFDCVNPQQSAAPQSPSSPGG